MKKIMIAVAIVCAAVIANASSVSWSAPGLLDSAGVAIGESTKEIQIAFSIWAADGTTALVTDAAGDINAISGAAQGKWTGASGNTTYWIQVVVSDNTGASLISEKAEFTTNSSATFKPNLTTGANMAVSSNKFAGSTWSVPEPTSGLLLLLGMAGLALKRKRA